MMRNYAFLCFYFLMFAGYATGFKLKSVVKSKDTVITSSIDSLHLAHLKQRSLHKSSLWAKGESAEVTALNTKVYRQFPALDKAFTEAYDITMPLANQSPEFSQAFLSQNFPENPKAKALVEKAKKAFEAVKQLQNFAEIITGKELLELPVGLSKKDSTSGNRVELAITEVKFLPKYAEFKAWAKLIIPVKSADGAQASRALYFGAEGIKLSKKGALTGDMKLVLLGEQAIPIKGDNWLLTLKGGVDLKTGSFSDKTYVEFDCSGLKSIGLQGHLRVSRKVLLPIDENGAYVCGDSTENTSSNSESTLNTQCYVGTDFSIQANGWNDLLLEINLPRFEVVGLKGWGFHIEQAVLDLSDSRNANNVEFPKAYQSILDAEDSNLWRGIYAKEVEIALPQGIERVKNGKKRVVFGAKNLVIDGYGVSGRFYGKNVLNIDDGAAGKWAFAIDSIGVTLSVNKLQSGAMQGDLKMPLVKGSMGYKGWVAPNTFGLDVSLKKKYDSPVFLGKLQLENNSSVGIQVKDSKVYPHANLTGTLSILGKIGQKEGDPIETQTDTNLEDAKTDSKSIRVKGITFQELELQTEPGKPFIKAKSFGFDGDMNLMAFPVTIKDLKMITPSKEKVGLAFDLAINLDKKGSQATTSLQVLGKLPTNAPIQRWEFEAVKLKGIGIEYSKSGFALKGKLDVMDNDPVYGDGFSGELMATFKKLNFTANAKAMFGAKDFRYWFVDIWTERNANKGKGKLLINSFVGGLSNRMRKVSGNSSGWTPSSAVYEPDKKIGLGLRAGVEISAKNKDAFSGKAYLEMQFNATGGLNRIGFTGEGTMMSKDKGANSANKDVLGKLASKIDTFIEKNPEVVKALVKGGNYLGLSKEAIPQRDIASQGKIGVYIGIEKDFEHDTFDGEFELYLSTVGVKGGGENNLAGYVKIHTSPTDWYIYVGTPTKRISLVFEVGTEKFEIGGYFMTGTKLPAQLAPHPRVLQILGDDILDKNRNEASLQAARGFAFGLNFAYTKGFNFAIFYAFLEVGAGFDVMHAYYPNARCKGRTGPIGNDGWYSTGQVYAYLYGEFGVKVNLAFIKGNFVIAEAGIAALLRGQFPNPAYFEGFVGMYYKILGGLVKGNMRMKIEFGDECELVGVGDAVGVPIIADVSPTDGETKVDVFAAPQAVFNYAANEEFKVDVDGQKRVFRLKLKTFKATSEGKTIEGKLEWNATNDMVTFLPNKTLPSQKKVQVLVEVSFEEKINGTFVTMTEDGQLVIEKREIAFTTDKAPDYIPWGNVSYIYPVPEQKSFHPEEYNTGYVKLKQHQDYLFQKQYNVKAEFRTTSNIILRSNASYDNQNAMVSFDIPEIDLGSTYQLKLLVFPAGQDVPSKIDVETSGLDFEDDNEGDTNWYDPTSGGSTNVNTSGSTTVSNKKITSVKLNTATPKSILDFKFNTSQYAKFEDKIQDLNFTDYVTNFIATDVHSMSIAVAAYENFEGLEVLGNKYTEGKPLIYPEAKLDDAYYARKIYPLIYKNYPLDGDITVNRNETDLGLPPLRAFYVSNQYMLHHDKNPNSYWVKNRMPFVYNLPSQYKKDMIHLRNELLNKYINSSDYATMYQTYKYLIDTVFPPLPLGRFKAYLKYVTPGNRYNKSYNITYKND